MATLTVKFVIIVPGAEGLWLALVGKLRYREVVTGVYQGPRYGTEVGKEQREPGCWGPVGCTGWPHPLLAQAAPTWYYMEEPLSQNSRSQGA